MSFRLPILTFHLIGDGGSPLFFSASRFRCAMAWLVENGAQTLPLVEAVRRLQLGLELPRRAVVLTFDDGDLSIYEEAWPVLREHGLTATVFMLPPGDGASDSEPRRFRGRPLMSWRQVREMHEAGIDFGAHTAGHPDLTRLSIGAMEAEILRSKSMLEDGLGGVVSSFAYPFGRHDDRCRRVVQQHFACACGVSLGLAGPKSDVFALERVDTYYLRSDRMFSLIFTRQLAWYLQARNVPRRLRSSLSAPDTDGSP